MPGNEQIRVRIAPSPTGFFHIGTARTALFNWLFAKKNKGVFIVRIEDTDEERSESKYEADILEGLNWLGLTYDEGPTRQTSNSKEQLAYKGNLGPYRQSERTNIYKTYIEKLLSENKAYYCFCKKEDLEAEKEDMLAQGLLYKYPGRCRNLSPEEVSEKNKNGEVSVIRFKMPGGEINFTDIIRGKITFDANLIEDIVIAKSPVQPLYNFAVAIDDFEMQISHVIRGEEHLANTPRQIAIQKALGFPEVQYAHLPLILNQDKSKMSKRFSATAVSDFKKQGYLPEAIVNFLALLGWHPDNDREIFNSDELIKEFEIKRVQKAGAVFNQEKLDWLNAQYLRKMPNKEIFEKFENQEAFLAVFNESQIFKILDLIKDRMKKLSEFQELSDFFFKLPEYDKKMLPWKKASIADTLRNLEETEKLLNSLDIRSYTKESLIIALSQLAERFGRGEVLWPLRVALSGKDASPGPYEIMEILGKEEALKRVKTAIKKLEV